MVAVAISPGWAGLLAAGMAGFTRGMVSTAATGHSLGRMISEGHQVRQEGNGRRVTCYLLVTYAVVKSLYVHVLWLMSP